MSKDSSLTDQTIEEIYRLFGILNEEQRQKVLNSFYIEEETQSTNVIIKGDNVTTPY